MAVKLVTPATSLPVSLALAKSHLRVDSNDEDALIDLYVASATSYAERFCGRAFSGGTWDYFADAFPADGGAIIVPLPPLQQVLGLFHMDGSVELEMPSTSYRVDNASEPGRVLLNGGSGWPSSSLRLRYSTGYATEDSPAVDDVPPDVRNAILLIAGTLYDNRETIVIGQTVFLLPWAAEQLLRFHRLHTALA